MHLGMPVVALATTEVVEAVPASAGVISTNPGRASCRRPALSRRSGRGGQGGPRERPRPLRLRRFLDDWDRVLLSVSG
jgi:hypothetical protein